MNVVILSARTGWHTDELCRALAERGHAGRVAPYESLRARIGTSMVAPLHSNKRNVEADLSASAEATADKQVRLDESPADKQVGRDEAVSVFEADAVLA